MSRVELLEAASMKPAQAVLLLAEAGERRLAAEAGELAEIVEFRALPLEGQLPSVAPRTNLPKPPFGRRNEGVRDVVSIVFVFVTSGAAVAGAGRRASRCACGLHPKLSVLWGQDDN